MDTAREAGLSDGAYEVLFTGAEEGRVEAALRAVLRGAEPSLTGLESSVIDGEGFGIEPFRAVVRHVLSCMALVPDQNQNLGY